ncbi:MAG: ABC transporter permease [Prosthecobacter sp.]|uniref:ABC transporter permease n=1 Tax=Prosthecobacter sp. TaxID=1965333 RepID=UPI003903D232
MFSFLLRRAFSSVIVIFCVISITFVLARITKGGPFDKEKEPPPHIKEALLTRYKLNGTVWEQYTAYVGSLVRFDLGLSTRYRDWRVSELLRQKMPNSFALGSLAFVIASCAGVFLGSVAAMKKDTWIDRSAMFGALLSISIPSFVSGPFLIAVVALWLGWLPVGGWGTLQQMILPAICLAAPYIAYVARLMRNSLLDVLKSDFLRTARAKGLTETQAVARHAVKVAILPVVTFLGPLAAHLLTGSMIVESVFNISGAGMIFVNSIQNRDVFLLGGAVIVYCVLLVLFNLFVDVLYTLLDKRIKLYA